MIDADITDNLMDGRLLPSEMPINKEISGNLVLKFPQDYERYGKISNNSKSIITKEISVRGRNYDNLKLDA